MCNHDGLNRQNAYPLNEFDQVDAPSHVSEYPCILFQLTKNPQCFQNILLIYTLYL